MFLWRLFSYIVIPSVFHGAIEDMSEYPNYSRLVVSQDVPSICYTNTNYESDSIPIGVLLVEEFGLSEKFKVFYPRIHTNSHGKLLGQFSRLQLEYIIYIELCLNPTARPQ